MIKKMILPLLALIFLCSCEEKISYDVPLSLSSSLVEMPVEGGWHIIGVYTEEAWTASFSDAVDWATIDRSSGTGDAGIRLECSANEGIARGVDIYVQGSSCQDTIRIIQASSGKEPVLEFKQEKIILAYTSLPVAIGIHTTVGDISSADIQVTGPEGKVSEWIKNTCLKDSTLRFEVGTAQAERTASIKLSYLPFGAADSLSTTIVVCQSTDAPYFRARSAGIPFTIGNVVIPIATNIGYSMTEMLPESKCSVSWANIPEDGWNQDSNELMLTITETPPEGENSFLVTIPYRDLSGNSFPLNMKLTRKTE